MRMPNKPTKNIDWSFLDNNSDSVATESKLSWDFLDEIKTEEPIKQEKPITEKPKKKVNTAQEVMGNVIQGFAEVFSSAAQAVGVATSLDAVQQITKQDPDLGDRYRESLVEAIPQNPIYQAGESLQEFVEESVPVSGEGNFLTQDLPRGVGSMLGFLTGGVVGSAGLGALSLAGSEFKQALDTTGDIDKALDAFTVNLPIGATEAVPISRFMSRINKATGGAVGKALEKAVTSPGRDALAQGFQEATQEIVQQVATNMSAKEIYDETRRISEGVATGGATGGTIGFMMGILAGAAGIKNRGNVTKQEKEILQKAESEIKSIQNKVEESAGQQVGDVLPQSGVTQKEFEQFVETGEVSNETLTKVSEKIKRNEPLTKEEESIAVNNQEDVAQLIGVETQQEAPEIEVTTEQPTKPVAEQPVDNNRMAINRMLTEARSDEQIAQALNVPIEDVQIARDNLLVTGEQYEQAKDNIRKSGDKLTAGVDPNLIGDYITAGLYHVGKGVDNFNDFVKKMSQDFGTTKGLRNVWDKLQDTLTGKKKDEFRDRILEVKKRFQNQEIKEVNERPSIELDEETIFQKLRRNLQNSLSRSEEVERQAKKKFGDLRDDLNFSQEAELYVGRATERIKESIEQPIYDDRNKNNFLRQLTNDGFSITDLAEYMYAKHAPERNADIKERFERENGSGLTDEQAQSILDKYKNTKIDKYANEFQKTIVQPHLDLLKNEGFIDEGLYNVLKDKYKNYVPLQGREDLDLIQGTGQGFSVTDKGVRKAKGRESTPDNVVAQSIMNYQYAIIRAEKNKVSQSLAKFVRANPNPNLWSIREVSDRGQKAAPNEISYFENGKRKIITVKDPALVDGLKKLGLQRGVKFLQNVNNFLRYVITIGNPEFMIPNFTRDLQTAAIGLSSEQQKGVATKVIKDIPKAMKGTWLGIREKDGGEWNEWFVDFARNGGKTGWFDHKSLLQKTEELEKKVRSYDKEGKVKQSLKYLKDLVGDANETVENAVRVSTYKNLVESGVSKKRAARYAKNLTVNFNKKGNWGTAIDTLYMFYNASIQGSARVFQIMKTPRGKKIAGSLVAMGALQNAINRFIDEEEYEKIPEYVRDSNWIIMLPGGNHLKIPLPYGFNIFPALGNVTTDVIKGQKIDKGASRLFGAIESAFNPLGSSGSIEQFISPTVTDPIVQLASNENFFSSPIRKSQPQFGAMKPNSQLYFESVRGTTKDVTDWLNRTTGGSTTRSGWIDLNPEDIDHVVDFVGGGLGRVINNSITTTESLLSEQKLPPINNVPLIRRFLGEPFDRFSISRVYELYKESGRTKFSTKERAEFLDVLKLSLKEKSIDRTEYRRLLNSFINNQKKVNLDR